MPIDTFLCSHIESCIERGLEWAFTAVYSVCFQLNAAYITDNFFSPPPRHKAFFSLLSHSLHTMPSVDIMDAAPSNPATQKSENQKSVKVLDELMNKLTISKTADETSAAAGNIATFINGDIEEHDAPTK